jgi:hypothetical protein
MYREATEAELDDMVRFADSDAANEVAQARVTMMRRRKAAIEKKFLEMRIRYLQGKRDGYMYTATIIPEKTPIGIVEFRAGLKELGYTAEQIEEIDQVRMRKKVTHRLKVEREDVVECLYVKKEGTCDGDDITVASL